ncbi:MAG: sugar ABC transporter ATP-binding protein [Clostridiales bacterium]|nr:sugar ABC transporter ATP-binding protein [Clostridiales bacterium]
MSEVNILEMQDISMHFPGVIALDHARLSLRKGEVLGLIGENGAGKSTMMNILLGSLKPTFGSMMIKGKPYAPKSPSAALELGISMIHQEVRLIPEMSVAENIWIGREKKFSSHGILNVKKRTTETIRMMKELDVEIDPSIQVGKLSIATMQLIEVLRAVSYDSDIIIMDEPTSALTDVEIQKLYNIIRKLSASGTSIIYISHKLEELFDVCNRVTVFRDGKYISTHPIDEIDQKQLVKLIVGRELKDMYPKEQIEIGDTVFSCKDLQRAGSFKDVSFEVHAGEILGFCGLMGAQRSEIMQSIFGLDPLDNGHIYLHGKEIETRTPEAAIRNHIALVTEDRLRRGGIHMLPIRINLSLAFLKSVCKNGFVNAQKELDACNSMVDKMHIKLASLNDAFGSLSGGNQQKVIIGRWMLTHPEVLILDEPTRGVDVGAKTEIYRLIGELAKEGKAIIMVSSELPELMGLSDRIIVVREGQLVAQVERKDFDQDTLMSYAFGILQEEA